jgi:hypothetical protein
MIDILSRQQVYIFIFIWAEKYCRYLFDEYELLRK